MAVMSRLTLQGPWTTPVRTVSSRRMFEPGFFAVRTPWIAPLVRRLDATPLFDALGPMPIENDLRRRTLRAIATSVRRRHGNALLAGVFSDDELQRLGFEETVRVDDLTAARWFDSSEAMVNVRTLREPHRGESSPRRGRSLIRTSRASKTRCARRDDVRHARGALHGRRPHAALSRRVRAARAARGRVAVADQLRRAARGALIAVVPAAPARAARRHPRVAESGEAGHGEPLLAAWLLGPRPKTFLRADAVTGVAAELRGLPRGAFLDPELAANPPGVVQEALDTCERLGIVIRDGAAYRLSARRTHPRFADVDDIVAFQARFLGETLDGLARVERVAVSTVSTACIRPAVETSNGKLGLAVSAPGRRGHAAPR